MEEKLYCVYIMASPNRKVLYTGLTSKLPQRVFQHREHLVDGFTKKYNVVDLVYYEVGSDVHAAIAREKQIKGWTRDKKESLIHSMNPQMQDLSSSLDRLGTPQDDKINYVQTRKPYCQARCGWVSIRAFAS